MDERKKSMCIVYITFNTFHEYQCVFVAVVVVVFAVDDNVVVVAVDDDLVVFSIVVVISDVVDFDGIVVAVDDDGSQSTNKNSVLYPKRNENIFGSLKLCYW